jgi:isoleucyl-tRNA synthetase
MQFREPNKGENFSQIEGRILKLWDRDSSFEKSLSIRKDGKPFSFYDGPPFATRLLTYY